MDDIRTEISSALADVESSFHRAAWTERQKAQLVHAIVVDIQKGAYALDDVKDVARWFMWNRTVATRFPSPADFLERCERHASRRRWTVVNSHLAPASPGEVLGTLKPRNYHLAVEAKAMLTLMKRGLLGSLTIESARSAVQDAIRELPADGFVWDEATYRQMVASHGDLSDRRQMLVEAVCSELDPLTLEGVE